ncbi:hypothetical protein E4U43_006832 [Claviceps pusilla]|uniref:Uncharacterized protein n=1 Tax=Claviceps pusilla TaxID=123648 RepID=A0A9P7SYH5_9HYPO|nr:hypothetical protein E4U43_006832 [Claviceps pusilla]
MEPLEHTTRDAADAGPLTRGGLLAIAICGGICVFTSLGFLMAWMVKKRQGRSSARMYTIPDAYSQTRLTKRPLMMTESAVSGIGGMSSRFSSRFSLTLPPIVPLPPMPSYSNFNFFRSPSKRRRRNGEGEGEGEAEGEDHRQSWMSGGEDVHRGRGGMRRSRDVGEAWFSRDSWLLGQAASMLSLGAAERGGYGGHGRGGGGGGGEFEDGMKPAPLRVHRPRQPLYEEYRKKQQEVYGNSYRGHPQQQPQQNPYQIFQQIPQQYPQQYSQQEQEKRQDKDKDKDKEEQQQNHQPPTSQHQQDLVLQKRRNGNTRQSCPTTPTHSRSESHDDNATRGRQPPDRGPPGVIAQAQAQPYVGPSMTMTDVGLRDILRSTDQRLREGVSRSPVKKTNAAESPARGTGTPVKTTTTTTTTPQSRRSGSTRHQRRPSRATPTPTPTPSPHKGPGSHLPGPHLPGPHLPHLHTSPTRASVTSVGSAANSLIAEATERLELPGGMASPSRLQGREWGGPSGSSDTRLLQTPSRSPGREGPLLQRSSHSLGGDAKQGSRSPDKRQSACSDQSSSLSTLYSVGEPGEPGEQGEAERQEEEMEIQRQYRLQREEYQRNNHGHDLAQRFVRPGREDDPFVESQPASRPPHMHVPQEQPAGPRPLNGIKSIKDIKGMSPSHLPRLNKTVTASAMVEPLRPSCATSPTRGGPPRHIMLPPPPPPPPGYPSDHVRPKGGREREREREREQESACGPRALAQSASESSFTSASVHTLDSDATTLPACETPRAGWAGNGNARTGAGSKSNGGQSPPPPTVNSPTRHRARKGERPVDRSSSPFKEEEMLAMLLQSGGGAVMNNNDDNGNGNSNSNDDDIGNGNYSWKRALPSPPRPRPLPRTSPLDASSSSSSHGAPTAHSPRPSLRSAVSSLQRKMSGSASSSYYSMSNPGVVVSSNGSPTSRGTKVGRSGAAASNDAPALGMTIAQLRRMNSITSSYSAASLTSTVVAETESDSATLPVILGGSSSSSFSSSSSGGNGNNNNNNNNNNMPRGFKHGTGAIGSKYYLNVGREGTCSASKPKSTMSLRAGAQNKRRQTQTQTQGGGMLKPASTSIGECGKENEGYDDGNENDDDDDDENNTNGGRNGTLDETPRVKVIRQNPLRGIPRDAPRSTNTNTHTNMAAAARVPKTKPGPGSGSGSGSSTTAPPPASRDPGRRPAQGPVAALIAQGRASKTGCRDSVESLGMYDQDGFLLPSPEREARRRRALRM